jgi:hypothetical protein
MTTNTAAVLPAPRQDPRQVVNTLRKTVNYNDVGIATGLAFDQSIPQGAFITNVLVEIVTAFNAGTTNVLTAGTNAASYNNIVGAADVNEGATGVTQCTRGFGRSLTAAADVTPYAMYTQTGGAATAGQAIILIEYEGGWAT